MNRMNRSRRPRKHERNFHKSFLFPLSSTYTLLLFCSQSSTFIYKLSSFYSSNVTAATTTTKTLWHAVKEDIYDFFLWRQMILLNDNLFTVANAENKTILFVREREKLHERKGSLPLIKRRFNIIDAMGNEMFMWK